MDYFKLYEDAMDLETDIDPKTNLAIPNKPITVEIIGTGSLTLNNINAQSNLKQLVEEIVNAIRNDKTGDFNNWKGKISLDAKLQSKSNTSLMAMFPKFPEGIEFNLEPDQNNDSHILSLNTKVPELPVVKEKYIPYKKIG
jgi:hypothetical protein